MRRFEKTLYVAGKAVKLFFALYDSDDAQVAMTSGKPYDDKQYLFLDYDEAYEPEEWQWITEAFSRKRAIIVESSPKRYWYLCFSPFPIEDILEIMWHSNCDKTHASHLFRDGFVGIRLSKKSVEGYPRVIKIIENKAGKNFYDFDREKAYRDLIATGVNFNKVELFKGLVNDAKRREEVDEYES